MYHYTYRIDDPMTGEFYFGSRTCNVLPKDDPYMGSMSTWKPEDPGRLIKTILNESFESRNEALLAEAADIIAHLNDPLARNYHIPGKGFHVIGTVAVFDRNGTMMRVACDDPRFKSGELIHVHKGLVRLVSPSGERRRVRPIKAEELLSQGWIIGSGDKPNIGKRAMYNPITRKNKFVKEGQIDNFIAEGWKFGQYPHVKITVTKNGSKKRIWPNEVESYVDSGWKVGGLKTVNQTRWMSHPATNRTRMATQVEADVLLAEGWEFGRTRMPTGLVFVTDGTTTRGVEKHLIDELIANGWRIGISRQIVKRIAVHLPTGEIRRVRVEELNEAINEGWIKGSGFSGVIGTKWLHRLDGQLARVSSDLVEQMLAEGWILGRK